MRAGRRDPKGSRYRKDVPIPREGNPAGPAEKERVGRRGSRYRSEGFRGTLKPGGPVPSAEARGVPASYVVSMETVGGCQESGGTAAMLLRRYCCRRRKRHLGVSGDTPPPRRRPMGIAQGLGAGPIGAAGGSARRHCGAGGRIRTGEALRPPRPDLPGAPSGSRAVRAAVRGREPRGGAESPRCGVVFRWDGGVGLRPPVLGLRGPVGLGMWRVRGWDGGEGLRSPFWGWRPSKGWGGGPPSVGLGASPVWDWGSTGMGGLGPPFWGCGVVGSGVNAGLRLLGMGAGTPQGLGPIGFRVWGRTPGVQLCGPLGWGRGVQGCPPSSGSGPPPGARAHPALRAAPCCPRGHKAPLCPVLAELSPAGAVPVVGTLWGGPWGHPCLHPGHLWAPAPLADRV